MTLERRYRFLLLAHSGPYRRRHGTEIVTTLMEMAEPGRRRPTLAESWDLIAGGLRQRLRVPKRPLTLLTAVLVAVVTMVVGAAAGSWLGERTFAPLPSDAVRTSDFADESFLHTPPDARRPAADPAGITTEVRDRLTAEGWTITSFIVAEAYPHPESAEPGTYFTAGYLQATRDGLIVHGRVDYQYADGALHPGGFSGTLFAQRTTAYLPLVIAGALLGLLAGWLLVAALTYRLRACSPARRRTVSLSTAGALMAAAAPAAAVIHQAIELAIHLDDTRFPVYVLHAALRVSSSVDGAPVWLIPACALTAAALGALTILSSLIPATHRGRRSLIGAAH